MLICAASIARHHATMRTLRSREAASAALQNKKRRRTGAWSRASERVDCEGGVIATGGASHRSPRSVHDQADHEEHEEHDEQNPRDG